ncbi:MAG TPA: hypothetical protein VGH04_14120, partial [Gemmatimonadaceae bacterium]
MDDTAISNSTAVAPLVLTPPQAVSTVTPEQAAQASTLAPEATKRLDAQVSTFIDDLLKLDIHSDAFQEKLGAVHTLGNADIQASAAV